MNMLNTMILIAGVAVAVAALNKGMKRELDYEVTKSSNQAGVQFYNFMGPITPVIPEGPQIANDFVQILEPAGLAGYASTARLERGSLQSYRWTTPRGEKISIESRNCEDGTRCVKRIVVSPDNRARRQTIAAKAPNMKFVSESDYSDWPFTVSNGTLRCDPPGAVIFLTGNKAYSLNGLAKSHKHYPYVTPLQKNDPSSPGLLLGYSTLLNEGLALCR